MRDATERRLPGLISKTYQKPSSVRRVAYDHAHSDGTETMMDKRDDTSPAGWADVPIVTETYRYVRSDGTEWLFEFDRALWVEMDGDRGYIAGNAHTHRARLHVCFPDQGYTATVSVYEFTAMSAEAHYWLKGFLTGSEPDVYEYLGRTQSEDYGPTDEELVRWNTFVKQYLIDGFHIPLNKRPDRALVITDEERAEIHLDDWRPWTYVGERVLVADGAAWVEADPQPQMDGPWLAGSVCAEREHDNLMSLESGWWVCCDCGEVSVDWTVDDD
jgi:hypothetical protein